MVELDAERRDEQRREIVQELESHQVIRDLTDRYGARIKEIIMLKT